MGKDQGFIALFFWIILVSLIVKNVIDAIHQKICRKTEKQQKPPKAPGKKKKIGRGKNRSKTQETRAEKVYPKTGTGNSEDAGQGKGKHGFSVITWALGYNAPMLSAYAPYVMCLAAIPAFIGSVKWLGWKRSLWLWGGLALCAYFIETIALQTGFPYGHFSYAGELGYKLGGITPWTVPFGWIPLILAAWHIAWRLTPPVEMRMLTAIAILLLMDACLDPLAVYLGFWSYANPGWWFGVPYTNYLGWIGSGLLGCFMVQIGTKEEGPPDAATRRWLYLGILPIIGTFLVWLTKNILG